MGQFIHLESLMTIRGRAYRNRLIAAPTLFAHSVSFLPEIAENVHRMVENRVRGGFATVSAGEPPANDEEGAALFMERTIGMDDYDGEGFKKIREYTDRIREHGAFAYPESLHEEAVAGTKAPYAPWGSDAYVQEDGVRVFALSPAMMEEICSDYRRVSKLARTCELDGVLTHDGHGSNMQQFISPWTSHRTDEFGGSMEDRARFPKIILETAREGIGEDTILELCMLTENGVNGGVTIGDTVELCREIDGMTGIIYVSSGLE